IEILNEVLETSYEPEYFDNPYSFYQDETRADINRAEKILGFKARYSIEEGIRDYLKTVIGEQ
ncbi:ADP-glyceromanno-heptose 6-epimerase, partial [bacterium]|nr:ADP-glyceromanno-heptose 6-epimerase [bacterium]MCG2677405.1 ADP-glyceromanno-heptose 6-epimerase [bacterium]